MNGGIEKIKSNGKLKLQFFIWIVHSISSLMLLRVAFGDDYLSIARGFFFGQILLFAAVKDLESKLIPDKVHVLIFLLGCTGINGISSVLGFLLLPLPFFITALMKGEGIGGGDIKLIASSGFLLGLKAGLIGSVIGLILAIVVNEIIYKKLGKDKSISFPMAPYLGIGCFLAYIAK